MTSHRQKQIEIINQVEAQIKEHTISFSTVSPVKDFENDDRICLTSVHLPHQEFKDKVQQTIIAPLKSIAPDYYFYPTESLHMTIKNVRRINNPPSFTQEDVKKVNQIFSVIIPRHKRFIVNFYRLLLFPTSLALMGTTDPELDSIFLDLDKELKRQGIPSDLKYMNSQYFYAYLTIARFSQPSENFIKKVEELSSRVSFDPYTIDSVTLLSCNAVLKNRKDFGTWQLQ